jgi:tryptophanyl-tRNA synthetase
VAYQWLYYFFEEDDSRMEQIRQDYVSGKLLTGELKEILIEKVQRFLEDFSQRREEAAEKSISTRVRGGLPHTCGRNGRVSS